MNKGDPQIAQISPFFWFFMRRGVGLLVLMLLTACGGAAPTATPLPPDVVRPVQPTPAYGTTQRETLATTEAVIATLILSPTLTPATVTSPAPLTTRPQPQPIVLPRLPPSGMGIATGGGSLLAAPGGRVVATFAVGEVVTVTGKSADGRYVAVYTNAFVSGWVAIGQLALYGVDDLEIVDTAPDPAPVATLLAEAMTPVEVLDRLVATPSQ
jgi:hypothetical protein